jgi:3-deoxy-7-phosphoheptulonate synthase
VRPSNPAPAAGDPRAIAGQLWPAQQQPKWRDHADYWPVRGQLRDKLPLVALAELDEFAAAMAAVARGDAEVLQLGDCAERLDECTSEHAAGKLATLDDLADELSRSIRRPVVRIGRLGGQLAKPRSQPIERHGDLELPAFRGHLVNSEHPSPAARAHDPRRMLRAYHACTAVHEHVRRHRRARAGDRPARGSGPWSSHEALVLDYEASLLRTDQATGRRFLGTTHFPWIGERTRQPHGGHVTLLASVANPVACKVGPTATVADILSVCERLDPQRTPGRLTLISRMGRDQVGRVLPRLLSAVRAAGHPVIWLCDPMHGNTQVRNGTKTRDLTDLIAEVTEFRAAVESEGMHPGGLHLESTPAAVTECLGLGVDEEHLHDCYTSLCDPRLNVPQTREVLAAWADAVPARSRACRSRGRAA